jgi:hypothetical protein
LENLKSCGGGDILAYELDTNKKCILKVTYESSNAKKQVLERKKLNFMNFKLLVSEPLNINELGLERNIFLVRNVSPNVDDSIFELFIENLLVNNDVIAFSRSRVFNDTYSVECKSSIGFDSLNKRLKRRPTLKGKEMHLLPAYRRNNIFVKKYDTN